MTAAGCILAALLLLVIPLPWLMGLLTAAVFHELCHILAVHLAGGCVLRIIVTGLGARIETTPMPPKAVFFCTMAGPAGSFLLAALGRFFPVCAACALVQGIYNLLPVYPLDGGRALRSLLQWLCPCCQGERICLMVEITTIVSVVIYVMWVSIRWKLGAAPVSWLCVLAAKYSMEKNILHCGASRSTIDTPYIMR